MRPKVTVILPCRNEATTIENTINSLIKQFPVSGGVEYIIADGMSDDGTRAIVQKLANQNPAIRMIDNPGRITSCGLNVALKAARGEIIVRMDAHTEYSEDYIQKCVFVLNESGADNVGGPWVARGVSYLEQAISAAFQCSWVIGGAPGHNPCYQGYVDTVYLGCWPKITFDKYGIFDEELVRNQDDEHNLRIKKGGGHVWQSPCIKSYYRPRNSLCALFRQYMQYGYWKVRVIQKHRITASFRHLIPAAFLLVSLVLSAAAPFSIHARQLLIADLSLYLIYNLIASWSASAGSSCRLLPVLPAVIVTYHVSYGYGFLKGIIDCFILKRSVSAKFKVLTR